MRHKKRAAPKDRTAPNTGNKGTNKAEHIKNGTCLFSTKTGEIVVFTSTIQIYAIMPLHEIAMAAAAFTSLWGVTEMAGVKVSMVEALTLNRASIRYRPYQQYFPADWKARFDAVPYDVKQAWAELRYRIEQSPRP